MKPTAPYYLAGEAGKSLDEVQISLADLCCYNATLSLRSLDVDTLTFQILGSRSKVIPDDGQWISLYDGTGTRLFTGIAKRTYTHPQGIYSYEVSNVYLGLSQTSLLSANGRPYVTYDQGDLRTSLLSILAAATAEGLPIQAPTLASTPVMFTVPKMSFRASSLAGALEDALKWAPDVTTRMDYATSPPTLRFYARTASSSTTINLDGPNHHATAVQLAAWPEARALSVAFVYAERDGDTVVNYRVQQAGDDTAEARRKLSVYLSGHERTDMMVSEAVTTSTIAREIANTSLVAVNAAITSVNAQISANYQAALAAIPTVSDTFNWLAYIINQDSALAAYPNLGWQSAYSITLYPSPGVGLGYSSLYTVTATGQAIYFSQSGYPVSGSPFTAAQLSIAGATQTAGFIGGNVIASTSDGLGNRGFPNYGYGYKNGYYLTLDLANAGWRQYVYRTVNVAVNFLSKAPSVIRAALQANAAATQANSTVTAAVGNAALINRAEFNPAPANLAANYFARQDWTPYKGSLSLDPKAADFPEPGDYLNIAADTTPAEWASMAAPVSELSIDLATGAAEVKIGPSPRMDFQSLIDRLRIPVEDNYQAG